jgi:hypothetical protein
MDTPYGRQEVDEADLLTEIHFPIDSDGELS